jgi:hypothetical protein
MLVLMGMQFIAAGLIGELLTRIYYESGSGLQYHAKDYGAVEYKPADKAENRDRGPVSKARKAFVRALMGIALLAAVVYLANPFSSGAGCSRPTLVAAGASGFPLPPTRVGMALACHGAVAGGRDVAGLRHALVLSGDWPECAAAWRCRGR